MSAFLFTIFGIILGVNAIIGLAAIIAKRQKKTQAPASADTTAQRLDAALAMLRIIDEHGDKQSARLARRALKEDAQIAHPDAPAAP